MQEPTRLHLSLNTRDLERSIDFYRQLLGQEPARVRADHAKFEVDDPPLVLTLNQVQTGGGTLSHLGLRVADAAALGRERERLAGTALSTRDEGTTHCCYALQDKTWVVDPDGVAWEVYELLQEDEEPVEAARAATCCPQAPEEARAPGQRA